MSNPFKRANSKLAKKSRSVAASAITDLWGMILTPTAPKKRISPKAKRPVTKKSVHPKKVGSKSRAVSPKDRQQAKVNGKTNIPATSRSSAIVPRGASFKTGNYACEFGERTYKLYIPANGITTNASLPLLVMLHGCSQTPDDFARGTGMNVLAEEFGFIVVYPNQSRKSQKNRCWNWYKRSDQNRDAGEPALIAGLTRHIIDAHRADPAKVYIAGLSAGASTALITANAYPDIFAAVGAHSGLPAGAAHDAPSALVAMRYGMPGHRNNVPLPTINFHGDADKVVNPRNGAYVATRATEPYPHLRRTEKVGYSTQGKKYVRTSHRLGKGRSFIEQWMVHGSGHAWSGGNRAGGFTDPTGPDASREMIRFFLRHRTSKKWRSSFQK